MEPDQQPSSPQFHYKSLLIVLLFLILAFATYFLIQSQTAPVADTTSNQNAGTSLDNELTMNEILNATYNIGDNNYYEREDEKPQSVTLTDGSYSRGYFAGKSEGPVDPENYNCYHTIWVQEDEGVIYMDYDDDGDEDAFVSLNENYCGGTGTYKSISLLENREGQPVYVDTISLGDRSPLLGIEKNEEGVLIFSYLTPGDGPLCCASTLAQDKYRVVKGELREGPKFVSEVDGWRSYVDERYGFRVFYPKGKETFDPYYVAYGDGEEEMSTVYLTFGQTVDIVRGTTIDEQIERIRNVSFPDSIIYAFDFEEGQHSGKFLEVSSGTYYSTGYDIYLFQEDEDVYILSFRHDYNDRPEYTVRSFEIIEDNPKL